MLFGFSTKDQRDFFIQILNIKGIGSQLGMSLLNKFSLNQLITAISNNDKKSISTVQGIGQKMTERIILELKSKVIKKEIEKENINNNKFYILVNCQGLGYEIQTLETVIFDINSNNISEKEIILWLKHIKTVSYTHLTLPTTPYV